MLTGTRYKALVALGCLLLASIIFATSTEAQVSQPTLTSVTIDSGSASNSATNELAKVGDTVTLSFTASEMIQTPTVAFTVGGALATGSVTVSNVTGIDWSAIATGGYHTVGLKSDGTLWTWGRNPYGQLGDGTTVDKYSPTQVGSATNWSAVAAGRHHTASLRSDDTLWVWGHNDYGQLGDGTTSNKITPTCSCVFYWTATFDLASGDAEGTVVFTIDFSDTSGNTGTQVTSTTDSSSVTLDKTAPTLTSVSIDSNNATSIGTDETATRGDTVTLSFTADETIQTPVVAFTVGDASTVGSVTVSNVSGNDWTATFDLASGDTEGAVAFTIDFSDRSDNPGTQVTSTMDGTSVVATTVPSPPTNVSAIQGNLLATVSWTAPASDGGSPITEYTVISSLGGITATTTATSLTVTGLTNGTAYTFTVTATNSNGTSLPSDASNSVTPDLVPGVPSGVSAIPSDVSALVSWTAPASDGGSPITLYTVTSDPGGETATTTSTSVTVTGLTQNTVYTFTVTATNAAGTSASSDPSPSVTTLLTNIWDAPSTSDWGLAALVAGMLVVMVIALGLTSGSRRAARP